MRLLLKIAVVGLVLVAVKLVFFPPSVTAVDKRAFREIAGEIAHHDVALRCNMGWLGFWGIETNEGQATFEEGGRHAEINIGKRHCEALARFRKDPRSVSLACMHGKGLCGKRQYGFALAAIVFAHEAQHTAGIRDEGITQCYALQTVAYVAERLGAAPADSTALARYVLAEIDPNLPPEYHARDCYDGGKLDLRPTTSAWPS